MPKPGKIQIRKYAPPPPELPIYGQIDPSLVSFIGRTNYVAALEEKRFVFGIKRSDRRRHLYIIGKSGVGKSKLLELLIRQDVAYGHGLCLLDPDGDVVDGIIDFIPEERMKDVVVIDPTDMEHPASFNPLANVPPAVRHRFSQGLIEIMSKQFGEAWSPRLEHTFRCVVLALLDCPEATMRGMIDMLTDAAYREKVLAHVTDDIVKRFWTTEFAEQSRRPDADAVVPLVNKLGQLLANPFLKNMFANKENKLDFDALVREKRIVLVKLAKDQVGHDSSGFLGAVIIAKLKEAGMARAALPEKDRSDFYIYIDEFNHVITETLEHLLSESRKYGFCLTVTHQYAAQLSANVQAAILGYIGNIIVFRVGGDDAARLKSEMAPVFDLKDMINLGIQEFYMKMTIDGESYDPFSAETLKVLPSPHRSLKKEIMENSRRTYAA